jgi:adenylate cyclase
LGGERRHITVLYAEVLPVTGIFAQMPAREFMDLLNIYLTVGTEAIHRLNGLIDKYMGSEIMGLFNTQLNPSEHHPWDAMQAAIGMVEDFRNLSEQSANAPSAPYYRIGIHTGIATLGNVGGAKRREFSAIGDTVNTAHRLLENAQPGEIVISREIYDTCAPYFQDVPRLQVVSGGMIQVKGKLENTEVFRVRRLD